MPRIGITAYDLLISCPGDVSNFLPVITEVVESFNKTVGKINDMAVVVKHWSTDSYSQSGGKPQEIINKQVVEKCDAAIAIFWTRFGTPTDNYGSGTEEEIEKMLSDQKQVFMYFLDMPSPPSKSIDGQYTKILEFKDRYKDRGTYVEIKDEQEFRRVFTNDLTLYFLSLTPDAKNAVSNKSIPVLKIKDAKGLENSEYHLDKFQLCDSEFIAYEKKNIIDKIEELQRENVLNAATIIKQEAEDNGVNRFFKTSYTQQIRESMEFMENIKAAKIADEWKKIIKIFAKSSAILIEENFWNIGDLKINERKGGLPYGNMGVNLVGKENEKYRYESIEALYRDIAIYNEFMEYFAIIDSYSFAKLAVSNVGGSVDEDIDVELTLPKECMLMYYDLPYPGIWIIGELLKDKFADKIFRIEENQIVGKYGYYSAMSPLSNSTIYKPFLQSLPTYSENKSKYKDELEHIFHYKKFENDNNDTIAFHIDYLKHNTSMAFPSILIFKKTPQYIEYKITSKYISEVSNGKIEFRIEE